MKYFKIEPPANGELGENAIVDFTCRPAVIHRAQFCIFYRPESDIILASSFFLITHKLKVLITEAGLTGVAFKTCEILKSVQYDELSAPDLELPELVIMEPAGISRKDDVSYLSGTKFLASERFLTLLEKQSSEGCIISPA